MSSPAFDARPLTDPVDAATARAYRKQLLSTGRAPKTAGWAAGCLIVAVVGVFGLVVVNLVFRLVFAPFFEGSPPEGAGSIAIILVVGLIAVGLTALIVKAYRNGGVRWYRLDHFARANGMTWYPQASNPPLPGMIFSLGSSRTATDILRGEQPRLVEFGNYRYTTGSGKNRTTHRWGYVAIRLGTPLPHIVLDAEGNNTFLGTNLPQTFDKHQRLSLEGDFDKYFSLYCPEGYEQDALYLFTPDIMARFIDNAAQLDVEIVDDWLFLYGKRDFSTLDPRTWGWLFSVVGALMDKLAQWERWRDDRLAMPAAGAAASGVDGGAAGSAPDGVAGALPFAPPVEALRPPPGVAPSGRRLKTAVPWATILIGGAIVIVWFALQSGVFGAIFSR
ncbi:hypothetical protein Q9S78_01755 [Microbacterium sp. KSW-18]|uniref:DUF3137 domain-containing protein n=1 Tax=Microbacterium aquilitoris TaxID=3067307 RepID=A0ABU3GGB5_9MICO|nr:hypothetical protein [Microbacterium sp. KSW-18]MDT3329385.1 hypothetical protein [Microbacterium sp. KSW-18]